MLFHFPFFYKRSAIFSQSIQYFSLISQRSFFSTKNISTNFNFDTSTSSTLILLFKTTKIYILTKKKKKKKSNSITFSQIISTNQFRSQLSSSLPKKKKSNSSSISFYPNSIAFPQIISTNRFRETIQSHIPCFASSGYTHTHTHNRSNGTRSFDLHKAWAYPFQGVFPWKDSVREMRRFVANNAEGMRVPVHLSVPVRRNFNV